MRKTRGFKIGKRLVRIRRWFNRKVRNPCGYHRLTQAGSFCKSNALSKFINWGRRFTNGVKSICTVKSGSGYIPIGEDPINKKPIEVPKGHLAVYVGQNNGDFHRVLVPVIYFNHPLFGELLRDAEKEYGFSHPGGITLPCGFSEFVKVQTRIAAGTGGRKAVWMRHP
ncbi:cysteine-rich repeat secretory protein 15-like isoform X1 [Hibiscus syriacus]|uniref:Cysteine-rich repeat secretory protein 15-like isoform X1 n=1 Tax=Hibiscus syriacus TaxID=106335 RepID=A0A6A3C361_HIBSY|nr:auxin-responsive protein SAUR36-like [Hibiscus syriacus]KAE8723326.1 cysteine-rich repeat secretory protein 15-like isoform X1 [Hibiscus syriacus]